MVKTTEERRDKLLHRRLKYQRLLKRTEIMLKKIGLSDPLTATELRWRDYFVMDTLKFRWFRTLGIRANHVSYIGLLFVIAFNVLITTGKFTAAFAVGISAVLTDFIDGPMARWKNPATGLDDVTGWGTFLDHLRDYSFALSFGWNAFFKFGHITKFEMLLAVTLSLSYLAILVAIFIKYQLYALPAFTSFGEKFNRNYIKDLYRRFSEFSLHELQTSFYGRVQFVLLALGVILLFSGKFFGAEFVREFSYLFLSGAITIGLRNLLEEYIRDAEAGLDADNDNEEEEE